MSVSKCVFRIWLLAVLLVQIPIGLTAEPPRPDNVAPELWQALATVQSREVLVQFAARANLDPAFGMDWENRGKFVVDALTKTSERSQAAAAQWLQARSIVFHSFINGNQMIIERADKSTVSTLAALPEVERIRETVTIRLPPVTTDALPQGTVTWGLKDTRAADGDEPGFWKTFGVKGDGIVVANIDTGVQWNHPALVNQFKCPGNPTDATCWRDPSNICGAGGACDNNGHGTHTMGTMVAKDDPALPYTAGMAPSARWIACKGCESNSCSDLALNTCADWILQPGGSTANRPHIVNNSWGGDGGDNWYLDKVQAWRAAGIFPAFSAGNSGSGCSTLGSPGDYQESFGSAAHGESRTIASFSSRGPGAFGHDPYTKPNISAPGVGVISTLPGNAWGSLNGTSMASPHTAGAVALLWSCNPGLRGQIDPTAELLQNTADAAPAGSCGAPPDGQGNYTYGYGYLNVLAAGNIACGGGASPMLRVKDITLVPSCRLRKVIANIGVVDQDDLAVSQATVSVKWIQPDGTTTAQKDTNASGKALFLKSAQPGVHNLCVENLTKSGYGYGKVEDCKKIEYQCQ